MENSVTFLSEVLKEIERTDTLHAKTLRQSLIQMNCKDFNHLRDVIYDYFIKSGCTPIKVAHDYMLMVYDMRKEEQYFDIFGCYSCRTQKEAYKKFYSRPEIMDYYMNALMISQLLWKHHFEMLRFFRRFLNDFYTYGTDINERVLDIGAGHGLYSKIVQEELSDRSSLSVMDISKDSLKMAWTMLGDKVNYIHDDVCQRNAIEKYDFIILGEVLEHLDKPLQTLINVSSFLSDLGVLFITVPTNAPAIDHIYLFESEKEVLSLVAEAGLDVISSFTAKANSQTELVGIFCINK